MKVKLQYLIEGQKVIMSTDREIVGQLKTVAKDDITSITSDDLGVVKVEVFGAWRLTRSESNVDVGEINITYTTQNLLWNFAGATTQEESYNDRIQSPDILLKEQKSLLKAYKSQQDKETKATLKSGKQPKSKQSKASSGVEEVEL